MSQILKLLQINIQIFTCDKAKSYNPLLKWQYWAQHTSSVLNFHGVCYHKTSEFLGVLTAQFTYELPFYSQSVTAFCPDFKTSFLSYSGVLYEVNRDTFREDHFHPHSCDLVSITKVFVGLS
jgi:hypothetical protein